MTYREKYDSIKRKESYESFLETNLKKALKCAKAYMVLGVCYRIGRTPSNKLFNELEKGREFLEEMEEV